MTRTELLAVAKRGIPVSAPMVQAIMEGRKTRFMEPMKLQPGDCEVCGSEERILLAVSRVFIECPSCRSDHEAGQWKHCVGDIVYVKETWARSCLECEHGDDGSCFEVRYDGCDIIYKADGVDGNYYDWRNPWKPSIHMPRAAARTFLRITGVRVQRLQELTDAEIAGEGIYDLYPPSLRHKENKSRWVSGFCSECARHDLFTGFHVRGKCGHCYSEETPDKYPSCGCWSFQLKADDAPEPPMYRLQRYWDSEQCKSKSGAVFWGKNPACFVYEFEVVPYEC